MDLRNTLRSWPFFIAILLLIILLINIKSLATWCGMIAPLDYRQNISSFDENHFKENPSINNVELTKDSITVISLDFKIKTLTQAVNLFETGGLDGIGLKVTLEKDIQLTINSKITNDDLRHTIWQKVTPNQWHHIEITLWKNHAFKIIYDRNESFNQTDKHLNYTLSSVRVGESLKPNFDHLAEVSHFKIENKKILTQKRSATNKILTLITVYLIIFETFLFVVLVRPSLSKNAKVECIALLVLCGFVFSVVFHYMMTFYWSEGYPYNTFLLYALGGEFGDFYISVLQTLSFSPYSEIYGPLKGQYFPLSYVLMYPFAQLNTHLALVLYSLGFLFCMWIFVKHYFRYHPTNQVGKLADSKNIFIIGLLSYPFLFCFERGNLESICFVFIALALYYYEKKKWIKVAGFIAMASAMKLYPLFFSLLLLIEKRYKAFVLSFILTALLMLLCLTILHPGLVDNITQWQAALSDLNHIILTTPLMCTKFNLGIWGVLKFFYFSFDISRFTLKQFASWYHICLLVGVATFSFYAVFIERIRWRQLFIMVAAVLIFPEISNDYKLLYVFLPLALFVNDKPREYDLLYVILFTLLLIPKNYYWYETDISISNLLNPLILAFMSLGMMISGVQQRFFAKRIVS